MLQLCGVDGCIGSVLYLPVACGKQVRDTWMGYWARVDAGLANSLEQQLEEKIKMAAKAFAPASAGEGGPSGGLSK
jgi:hypothetical protein